jgi:hypothetical protein
MDMKGDGEKFLVLPVSFYAVQIQWLLSEGGCILSSK